jgi:uncharacterized protein (TIGR03000 family)
MCKRGSLLAAATAGVLMFAGVSRAQTVGIWSSGAYPGYPFGFIATSIAVDPMPYVAFYPPVFPPNTPVAAPASGLPSPTDTATIEVFTAPDAVLTFDGHRTLQTGPFRRFTTPPLVEGKGYHYTVEATFTRDGQKVTEKQSVAVSAGGQTSVTFPVAK